MKVKLIGLLLGLAVICSNCSNPETEKNTDVSGSSTEEPAKEHKMMIIAKVNVKPENANDFIEAAKAMIEKSNNESGCSFYQLYQDPYDNSKMVFVEEYLNQAAVDEHFATEYFEAFGDEIADFVDGPAEIKIISVEKEEIK